MHKAISFLVCCLLACAALCPVAMADVEPSEPDLGIGTLSDRFSSLNNLGSASNSDEDVVVDTRVGVLTSANLALNNMQVRFSGEAVGDVLYADADHKWVNVLGASGTSIGVFMTNEQAAQIVNLGDYKTSGTMVEVRGTYCINCSDHQGELDVHASSVIVTDTGGAITHTPNTDWAVYGLFMSVIALAVLLTFIFLRRRNARKQEE